MTNVPTNSTLIDEMDSPILRPNQASLRQQSAAHPGSLSCYDTWLFQRSGGDDSPGPAFDLVNPALFWSSDPLAQARLVKSRKVEYVVVEDSGRTEWRRSPGEPDNTDTPSISPQ